MERGGEAGAALTLLIQKILRTHYGLASFPDGTYAIFPEREKKKKEKNWLLLFWQNISKKTSSTHQLAILRIHIVELYTVIM